MILLVCNLPTPGVQLSRSAVSDSVTPWTAAGQVSLSITNSPSLFKLTSIESVMPSDHLILCRPLLLLPSIFPSSRVFSNESVLCTRWPKDWSFSFSISPSGLISFWIDKTWPTRQGNGKPLQYSCLENPMWKSFRHVWLSVTPWLSSPGNSPGQNAGVSNLSKELHQGSSLIFICGIPLCGIKIELFILLFILFFKFYFFGLFCIYFLSIYCLKDIYHIFITSLQTFNRSQRGSSKPRPRSRSSSVNGSAPGSARTCGAGPSRGQPPFPAAPRVSGGRTLSTGLFPRVAGCPTHARPCPEGILLLMAHSPFDGILFYWFFSPMCVILNETAISFL